jgi:hypothetical protein
VKVDSRHSYDEESLHNGLLTNASGVGYGKGVAAFAASPQLWGDLLTSKIIVRR